MFKALELPDERAFIRYVEISGEDPPILWLHGLMCSSTAELLPAAVAPSLRHRHSYLIDFLGHGYSDRPAGFGYATEDNARTIVALIDQLGVRTCAVVGHSRGGGVGILVAAARPNVVELLVMAEGDLGGDPGDVEPGSIEAQTENQFVAHGFGELVEDQARLADENPTGLMAMHLGMTQLVAPIALHRAALSLRRDTDPPLREVLKRLSIPRWYLDGANSEPWGPHEDLNAAGIEFRIVPDAGHAIGLQNPAGFADLVAEAIEATWPR